MISEQYYSKKIQTETKRTMLNPVLKSEQLSGDLGAFKEIIDDIDENGIQAILNDVADFLQSCLRLRI